MKRKELWKIDLDKLTPRSSSKYDDSLEVLRLMRQGYKIRNASKEVEISPTTVKKYVGSAIKKKNNVLVAKSTDSLLRKMRIYEDGQEKWIQVRGRKNSSIIGQYHSAVGRRVDKKEKNALELYKKIKIRDAKNKVHVLETDSENIFDIFDRRQEPEFFRIYQR